MFPILFPCLAALVGVAGALHPPTATLASGALVGTRISLPSAIASVNRFLGIPFAQSPPLRFAPPSAVSLWKGALDASKYQSSCIQQFNYPETSRNLTIGLYNTPMPVESEDCMYLNVYAPSTPSPKGGRAVMFWLYGGSLRFGNAGQPIYDGSEFAAYEDVIVVTANYRTNVFGFPNSPELPLKEHNIAFLDQRFALEWVQTNIHAFGGSPKKVTIFGESAGAQSVDVLVTSMRTNPPFRAAIMQSGQMHRAYSTAPDSTKSWLALAAAFNCSLSSNITCLRAVPAQALKEVIERNALSFLPRIDGHTWTSNITTARPQRRVANVPILAGTVSQEGRTFAFGQTNLAAFIASNFASTGSAFQSAVANAYAVGTGGTTNEYEAISAIYTDFIFQCPAAEMLSLSAKSGYPTWRFLYDAAFANTGPSFLPPGTLGVFHGSEIFSVFSTYTKATATAQQVALSNYMRGAWARFAKNPTAGPGWPKLGDEKKDVAVLGRNGSTGATMAPKSAVDALCAIWAPIYAATVV